MGRVLFTITSLSCDHVDQSNTFFENHFGTVGTTVICRHASDQQSESCTRPILHSALGTKMGQAPTESYTELPRLQAMTPKGCRVANVKMPSYDAIFSWSEKTALFGVSPLVSQLSLSSFASNLDMFYRWDLPLL